MKNPIVSPRQVLIIGAGIGGLSTAIILAKVGFGVTVLEKNPQPGGLLRSYSREGIDCDVGVHYLGSLDEGQILKTFFDYLGISKAIPVTRMGQGGIIDRYVFNSPATHPATFDLPQGLESYEHNLNRAFPEEGAAISKIVASIRKADQQLHGLNFLYTPERDFFLSEQFEPLGAILSDLRCSPGLRSVLAVPACWIGVPLNDCPAYYHNMALASYIASSWRLDRHGAAMADAFADRLKQLGGRIITSAEVQCIKVESRVVKGVQLQSGENLQAATVIGAIHPKIVLRMLAAGDVKPSYRQRISSLQDTHGIFSVQVTIDGTRHPEIPYNIFKIDSDQEGNVPDLRYYQIKNCNRKGISLLSILTSGKNELWAPWANTNSGRRGSKYLALKKQHALALIDEAEQLFGSFKEAEILDTYTPLSMRDWVGSPGGSAYGVQRSSSQMLATAMLNRTAVKGLYLAGQSVLAPGVIGTIMGSFATVKLALGTNEFNNLIRI